MSAVAWSQLAQERESCPRMGQAQGPSNPGCPGKSDKQELKVKASPTPMDLDPVKESVGLREGDLPPFL